MSCTRTQARTTDNVTMQHRRLRAYSPLSICRRVERGLGWDWLALGGYRFPIVAVLLFMLQLRPLHQHVARLRGAHAEYFAVVSCFATAGHNGLQQLQIFSTVAESHAIGVLDDAGDGSLGRQHAHVVPQLRSHRGTVEH